MINPFKIAPTCLSERERLEFDCRNVLMLRQAEDQQKVRENRQLSIKFKTPDATGATPEAYWINFVLSNRNKQVF